MSSHIELNTNEHKRTKLDNDGQDSNIQNLLLDYEFVKVLNDNSLNKLIIVQAARKMSPNSPSNKKNSNNQNSSEIVASSNDSTNRNAVIIFEKSHFSTDETKSFLETNNPQVIEIQNNIYNKFSIYPTKPFNSVQVQLIYPATDDHIAKYADHEMFFITETYQDWLDVTSKFIKESSMSLEWVYNILEHKKESERIVFEDIDEKNGFILLPDMKWNSQIETLYLLAIVKQRNIESLRTLTGEHISLLENIRDKSFAAIESKFGIKKSKIRAYIHYQPSFYHFHIHFTHIRYLPPGVQERNYQLNQVIENLKLDSDYYKKVSLEYAVRKNEKLYDLFKHKLD